MTTLVDMTQPFFSSTFDDLNMHCGLKSTNSLYRVVVVDLSACCHSLHRNFALRVQKKKKKKQQVAQEFARNLSIFTTSKLQALFLCD